ncbi:uncharacterized protein BP5553_07186 [Venustampulla echinocandica]|uniref:Elongator complex protein 5 n=1 Tax=Venustampulla echinocandica TaxID=2656787 RepID=A0A370TIR5_9HELO|nr:uncharacterized protein BP5553_07186 [Venustampulla echinocandica]RDL35255.1 hypothetical protein BP5553_07186 [Venustampulla echinocandica]
MAPSALQQRRTHNTLLFQKLLNLRDGASPFTLVLDTLEQGSGPVVREFARRAKMSKTKTIFISFTTLRKKTPFEPDIFISARGKQLAALRAEILSCTPPPAPPASTAVSPKTLLIIDNLHPLCTPQYASHLSTFLSSLLISPQISLLSTYHADTPIPLSSQTSSSAYTPHPLTTLLYLSTAILTLTALPQILSQKRARDKSLVEPVYNIASYQEGVLVSLPSRRTGEEGVVIHMELRRRSGRGVVEDFVLTRSSPSTTYPSQVPNIILLDEHPLYSTNFTQPETSEGEEEPQSTFNLGLTEKQKRDRENVVLPYFDAQKDVGSSGEGGRILYDMGAEDREDFDDEEDEI